ncbi:MAG: diacylglycerol kinase family protein [Thermodesulfobacteriota bacterium]|nr:diacylglycerol kinase family protein [Thermodesulfobacteriota bacterium]
MSVKIKRALVLVNPISGKGRGREVAGRLGAAFEQNGLEAEIIVLPGPGSVAALVRDSAPDHQAVVAVGGDGTVNEVAEALLTLGPDMVLGVVPLGLSNCLARVLGLPLALEKAVGVMARGRTKRLDLAWAGDHLIAAFLGAGFDAAVVEKVARTRHGGVHNRDYIRAAGPVFFSSTRPEIRVEVDGRLVEGHCFQVILSAIGNYARYFRLADRPGFTAYLFKGSRPKGLVRALAGLGPGRNLGRACDLALPVTKTLSLTAKKGRPLFQVDGEARGPLPVDCRVSPEALEVLVP